jgi:hypothetical protein
MKPKVYIETSVISYLTARPSRDIIVAANQQATQEWWQARKPDFDIYISQLVIQEANAGDAEAASNRQEILKDLAMLDISREAVALAERLIKEKAIPEQKMRFTSHLRQSTVWIIL